MAEITSGFDDEAGDEEDKTYGVNWDETPEAAPRKPLVTGDHRVVATVIEYRKAKTGTEGVAVTFRFTSGPNKDVESTFYIWARNFRTDMATSPARMLAEAKRDLKLLGFTNFDQIDSPPAPTAKEFIATVTRDDDAPLGKIWAINKAP